MSYLCYAISIMIVACTAYMLVGDIKPSFDVVMFIDVEMTEGQMFDAMLSFAENIPSEAFHKFIDGFAKDGE